MIRGKYNVILIIKQQTKLLKRLILSFRFEDFTISSITITGSILIIQSGQSILRIAKPLSLT